MHLNNNEYAGSAENHPGATLPLAQSIAHSNWCGTVVGIYQRPLANDHALISYRWKDVILEW